MNKKCWPNLYHVNLIAKLLEKKVIQIKSCTMINADMNVKNIICEKDYIWNPAHVVAKLVNI